MLKKVIGITLVLSGFYILLMSVGVFSTNGQDTGESWLETFFSGMFFVFFGWMLLKSKKKKQQIKYKKQNFEPGKVSFLPRKKKFIGKQQSITIAGKQINSPLIYIDPGHAGDKYPHVIYTQCKIRFTGTEEDIGYWPSYSDISAYSRGKLITWLEGGRNDIDLDIGLLFIYFYGLEFRAIYEKLDQKDILNEVIRLYRIYNFNRSFKNYAGSFIAWLILSIDHFNEEETAQLLDFMNQLNFNSPILSSGAFIKLNNSAFTKDILMQIIAADENTTRSKIPVKLGRVFEDYFMAKIENDWSELLMASQKVAIHYKHYCATPLHDLNQYSSVKALNYTLPKKWKNKLAKIWQSCIEDLKPYSRKMGKAKDEELFSLLPKELKETYTHPFAQIFETFALKKCNHPCKAGEIAGLLGWGYSERLTMKQSKQLSQVIEEMGYCTEPDARYGSKSLKWDDFVVFYQTAAPSIPKNSSYSTASMLFDLGVYISRADSFIEKDELDTIEEFIIANFCADDKEIERIHYRRKLAETGVIKGTGIAGKLADRLKLADLKKIGSYLFMVAASDGTIDQSELKAIKKIYQDFGLDEKLLNMTLEEYQSKVEIVTATRIKKATGPVKTGSAIPQKQQDDKSVINIDPERLKAVLKETENVKAILGEVFTSQENQVEQEILPVIQEEPGLSKEINQFMHQILHKDHWERDELRRLALEHKIMLDSAIEQINFWCEEENGDELIFDNQDSNYTVQKNILAGEL